MRMKKLFLGLALGTICQSFFLTAHATPNCATLTGKWSGHGRVKFEFPLKKVAVCEYQTVANIELNDPTAPPFTATATLTLISGICAPSENVKLQGTCQGKKVTFETLDGSTKLAGELSSNNNKIGSLTGTTTFTLRGKVFKGKIEKTSVLKGM